ncbi:uncharacterized protein LOC110718188 [Chenopodium quinoa]|uniref:uncharacterized protein LOC110718188 n=1 Tax=Chenopodium quinoa TaxID=63459 RepID=UPI000B771AE2|nr:uncharacterized protein LOC110718188 [Chenopodium quinoa]
MITLYLFVGCAISERLTLCRLILQVMLRIDGLKVPLRKKQEEDELIKELTMAMETANQKASDLELQVKNLQFDLKALEGSNKENTELREDVSRLRTELAQTQADHKAELAAKQERLIAEKRARLQGSHEDGLVPCPPGL